MTVERTRHAFVSDGSDCCGYLYLPSERKEPLPCVVMGHGFGGTQEGSLAATAEDFALAGLAVFTFDYRGFGASGGEPRQVIALPDQLNDWHAAIAYARSLPAVDADRVAIWGSSLSGAHVVYVAAQDERIGAVVAQIPFNGFPTRVEGRSAPETLRLLASAVKDWWRGKTGKPPLYVPMIGRFGDPAVIVFEGAEDVIASQQKTTWRNEIAPRVILHMAFCYRPARRARSLKMPILVCLAQADKHTPAKLSRRIADSAPLGELRRYPCTHFEIYQDAVRKVVDADQISFLKTHLFGLPR